VAVARRGKGSAHERSPINWGVVATRDALLVELALWGDDINVIRKHVQAAEIASGIGKAVKNAYQAIDRMADRKYLGKCNHKIEG
jgi:chaperonin GroEL (HSP60 family)